MPLEEEKVHAKTLCFHCPMHPEQKSDQPRPCPICGMRMEPKEQREESPLEVEPE